MAESDYPVEVQEAIRKLRAINKGTVREAYIETILDHLAACAGAAPTMTLTDGRAGLVAVVHAAHRPRRLARLAATRRADVRAALPDRGGRAVTDRYVHDPTVEPHPAGTSTDGAVKVTISDPATGEVLGEQVVSDDYMLICAGRPYLTHTQVSGSTHTLTIKDARRAG